MTALSDYLWERANAVGVESIRGFAKRVDVAVETARRMLQGTRVPDEDTLQRVADKLPASLRELRWLAGLPVGELEPFVLPPEANQLNRMQREVVLTVVRGLLHSSTSERVVDELGEEPEAEADVTASNVTTLHQEPGERPRVTRAARKRPKPTSGESEDPNGR